MFMLIMENAVQGGDPDYPIWVLLFDEVKRKFTIMLRGEVSGLARLLLGAQVQDAEASNVEIASASAIIFWRS